MNITFIGGGNMASAIIGGLTQRGWDRASLRAVEILPGARAKLEQSFGIQTHAGINAQALQCDCIVLAIKPQQMREVATQLAQISPGAAKALVISIAAGIRVGDSVLDLHEAGLGVEGAVEGRHVVAGRARFLGSRGLITPRALARAAEEAEAQGHTPVLVAWDGRVRGVLAVADTVKPTSAAAGARLRALGLTPGL